MTQCSKCGRSDRVVSKTYSYWGKAIMRTFWGFLAFMFIVIKVGIPKQSVDYVFYIGTLILLFSSIGKWKKAINGESYYTNECKACGNKWDSDY